MLKQKSNSDMHSIVVLALITEKHFSIFVAQLDINKASK